MWYCQKIDNLRRNIISLLLSLRSYFFDDSLLEKSSTDFKFTLSLETLLDFKFLLNQYIIFMHLTYFVNVVDVVESNTIMIVSYA